MPKRLDGTMKALRHRPKLLALVLAVSAAVAVLGGLAWANRAPETWVGVSPDALRLPVGASQQLSVSLQYKPRFRGRGGARPIAGTIQLISFPTAVEVNPKSLATSRETPLAALTVTGLRAGEEELIIAASNTPAQERSWRTVAVQVVVAAGAPQARNR